MTVTVITGASRGIGAYLADNLPGEIHRWDRAHGVDVTDEHSVRKAFADLPRIDNLINCAGVAAMNSALLTPMATARKVMETNVLGTFLLCREAARVMMRQGAGGRIVNFSSVAVPLQVEGEAIYAASKAAVETLTKVLAREFGPMGITVNTVGPNPIETGLIAGVPTPKIEALLKRQAIDDMGTFEDVLNVVEFFLREESEFITGQTVYLGGVC